MKILPSINCEFAELRKRARSIGYRVKSQTVGFEGDLRKVWCLIHIASKSLVDPFSVMSEEKRNSLEAGFNLLTEVTKKE